MASKASFTAETMALQRAFESRRPSRRRLFVDPYAHVFLRPGFRALAAASAVPGLRRLAVAAYDSVAGPGPRPSAIIRTKVIDDALTEATPDQCVLLGAGYDTRAHRLEALAAARVFEVDHPDTQEAKRAGIDRLGLPSNPVTYVGVDFERDDLAARLIDTGFDPSTPTAFLWEGVSQYLTARAVDQTLSVIRSLAPAGGLLIMTYVDLRAMDRPSPFPEARRWLDAVNRAGEPWLFGLLPGEAREFFSARGFSLSSDVSMRDVDPAGSALYRVTRAEIVPA